MLFNVINAQLQQKNIILNKMYVYNVIFNLVQDVHLLIYVFNAIKEKFQDLLQLELQSVVLAVIHVQIALKTSQTISI